jgi:hypothetical protein
VTPSRLFIVELNTRSLEKRRQSELAFIVHRGECHAQRYGRLAVVAAHASSNPHIRPEGSSQHRANLRPSPLGEWRWRQQQKTPRAHIDDLHLKRPDDLEGSRPPEQHPGCPPPFDELRHRAQPTSISDRIAVLNHPAANLGNHFGRRIHELDACQIRSSRTEHVDACHAHTELKRPLVTHACDAVH